ncbi:hypothetical protein P3W33_08260 [Luteibacter sp. PPL552]
MLPVSTRPWFVFVVAWCLVAWSGGAWATVSVEADALDVPGLSMSRMTADIGPADEGKGLTVRLSADRADVPSMGWKKLGVGLDGHLDRDEAGRWIFDGRVRLHGAPGGALTDASLRIVADESANTLEVSLIQDKAHAAVAFPLDQPTHAQITLKGLPAGWLQGLVSTVWAGRLTAGKVDADLALDLLDQSVQAAGQFALDGVAFEGQGGKLAGNRLSANGRVGFEKRDRGASIDLDGSLRGGELLLGPLYAALPAHPVQLSMSTASTQGALAIQRLRVTDPDALQLEGELGFDAKGDLDRLNLDRFTARFPAAYTRYGTGLLRTFGIDGLAASGGLAGSVSMDAKGLSDFSFQTDSLDLTLVGGRFGVSGLHGAVDWSATGERPPTTLGWRGLQMLTIPNGPAQGTWQSRDGTLALTRPMSVPVLDGQLRVLGLRWKPSASSGERLQTSLALTQVDMAALCRALGWPAFKGTVGGAVPNLRYVDDRVELGGGLSLNVFDGFVDITGMTLAHPFGDAPVVTGDVALRNLDLGLLTSVFDFGNITGRMSGAVEALRLVGWKPAAFNAHFLADQGGRISQQAVNNLTSVGGGGIAGGLQGTMLKIFKTFGYRRIGLSCVLKGDVCTMGGLGNARDGYTIVEGSGLPRLTVVGHQRDVDWPTLVRRLQAATEGDGPVVR